MKIDDIYNIFCTVWFSVRCGALTNGTSWAAERYHGLQATSVGMHSQLALVAADKQRITEPPRKHESTIPHLFLRANGHVTKSPPDVISHRGVPGPTVLAVAQSAEDENPGSWTLNASELDSQLMDSSLTSPANSVRTPGIPQIANISYFLAFSAHHMAAISTGIVKSTVTKIPSSQPALFRSRCQWHLEHPVALSQTKEKMENANPTHVGC
ncbi:hypothetical protein I7I51_08493 [Histoplasma capsulatum]|uniref:Uncharacterized protein n=1 Tax=Ajellomyces capsulatus TaxID=5037 RepID=A0A8A1LZ90_AJECA|nr:hypothetical protein I7I51_08493 [Histoplasma capsulatum]